MTKTKALKDLELHRLFLKKAKSGRRINWSGEDFSGFDLKFFDLRQADLSRCTFTGADLSHANFAAADLSESVFTGAKLIGANLYGADLRYADLRDADLNRANLADVEATDLLIFDGLDRRVVITGGWMHVGCVRLKVEDWPRVTEAGAARMDKDNQEAAALFWRQNREWIKLYLESRGIL
jgi:hypothetical protein